MTQIDAEGKEDNTPMGCVGTDGLGSCSTFVEALVSRACDRQAVGTTASTTSTAESAMRLDCYRQFR